MLQIIFIVIVYLMMLFIIGELVYILIDMIKDDIKQKDFTITPITILGIGTCITAIIVIGLLPILR